MPSNARSAWEAKQTQRAHLQVLAIRQGVAHLCRQSIVAKNTYNHQTNIILLPFSSNLGNAPRTSRY